MVRCKDFVAAIILGVMHHLIALLAPDAWALRCQLVLKRDASSESLTADGTLLLWWRDLHQSIIKISLLAWQLIQNATLAHFAFAREDGSLSVHDL